MGMRNKLQRREKRGTKKLRQLKTKLFRAKTKLSQAKAIVQMAKDYPDLETFVASLDTSEIRRLLGVFFCSPEEYLETEAVLERNGHPDYRALQGEIDGDPAPGGDGKGRGWTSAVKYDGEPDGQFRVFVGIVKQSAIPDSPTGDSTSEIVNRWGELIAVVHELGHAHDLDQGITFHVGQSFSVEEAEYVAHDYACRFLRKHRMTMGLISYLSMAICPIVKGEGSHANAARRFMASDEYRVAFRQIPRAARDLYNILEAHEA